MGEIKDYIIIDKLYKSYGKRNVINGISLRIKKGTFFGLFGKNGAGKTTLFKHILGMITSTKGNIYLDGKNISKVKDISIGYLPENVSIYGHLNVVDNLKVAALSSGNDLDADEISDILNKINLKGSERSLAKSLSLGMKRRLQFAMATMIKPVDILILDEPTNGMDINGVLWLKDYLINLKKKKITILICSHSLNIMEDLIDEYCIMKDGKVIKNDFWEKDKNRKFEVYFENKINEEDKIRLSKLGKITKAEDYRIQLISEKNMYELVKALISQNINIKDIEQISNGLEDIFIESVN